MEDIFRVEAPWTYMYCTLETLAKNKSGTPFRLFLEKSLVQTKTEDYYV